MSHKPFFHAAILVMILLTACGSSGTQLTADNNGGQVEIKAGEEIVISLIGNPSTGYTWEAQNLDPTMFAQVGEAQFISDNENLVGSGGTLILTFKALQTGTTTLTLVYHRPWETGAVPIDTFSVTVTVK